MKDSHEGRTAVVTGAAGGFGTAISKVLAERGANIVAVDLDPVDETVAAAKDLGCKAVAVQGDLSTQEGVAAITDQLFQLGKVDILINNAGAFPFIDLWDLTFEQWKKTQAINLDSQFLMTKAVMGQMRDNGWGRIVNIASNSLGLAVPSLTHYMAAKGGVIGMTRALGTDLAPYGITVNAICPTASRTPGGEKNIGDFLEDVAQMQAIKRVGVADDIVGAVAFLSSDDSAFMTGQTMVVDGGLMRV